MYEGIVQDLIDQFGRLPGIGPKGAQRIAFYVLQADQEEIEALSRTLSDVKRRVRFCERCGNVAEESLCRICADPRRDDSALCVVEEPKDVVAVERTREFRGRYHVLGGAISPIDGIGPDNLRIRELMARLASGELTDNAQLDRGTRHVLGAHGVAIDRAVVARRHDLVGHHSSSEHQP